MGQTPSQPKNKHGTKVLKAKVEHAAKTGILSLTEHKLKEIPSSVAELGAKLKVLDLSQNSLSEIDCSPYPSLKTLKVGKNKLEALDVDCVTLDASENKLATFRCRGRLESLTLKLNPLDGFPSLSKSLKFVDLSGCGLSSFDLTDSPVLTELILDSNALTEVPANLPTLAPKLRHLSVEFNRIRAIPPSLLKSPQLDRLNLKGNPIPKAVFIETDGADDFLKRRERTHKKADTVADKSICGLLD